MIALKELLPIPLDPLISPSQIWNTSMVFEPENYYLIQAPSGKGKTTLLNILYGLRTDYKGSWNILGECTTHFTHEKWTSLRNSFFAYVFQDLKLFPQKTGIENLELYPNKKLSLKALLDMAEMLDIGPHLHRPVQTFSLGQQQRLSAIRALSRSFKWLLLDEPFSHLDKNNADILMQLFIQRSKEENASIIVTSLGGLHTYPQFSLLHL